jgi:hypothetical protein
VPRIPLTYVLLLPLSVVAFAMYVRPILAFHGRRRVNLRRMLDTDFREPTIPEAGFPRRYPFSEAREWLEALPLPETLHQGDGSLASQLMVDLNPPSVVDHRP